MTLGETAMPDAEEFAPKRPSRKRLLLWLIPAAIVLVLIALVGSRLMEYRRNRAVAERVAELGGSCGWAARELPWPFTLLGEEWSHVRLRLCGISLRGTPVGDEDLACFAGLAGLKILVLDNTQIADAGLAHVAKLAGLRVLLLDNTQVTDAGVKALKEALPNLAILR